MKRIFNFYKNALRASIDRLFTKVRYQDKKINGTITEKKVYPPAPNLDLCFDHRTENQLFVNSNFRATGAVRRLRQLQSAGTASPSVNLLTIEYPDDDRIRCYDHN